MKNKNPQRRTSHWLDTKITYVPTESMNIFSPLTFLRVFRELYYVMNCLWRFAIIRGYKSHREERTLMCKELKEAVHYSKIPTVLGSVHLGSSHDSFTRHGVWKFTGNFIFDTILCYKDYDLDFVVDKIEKWLNNLSQGIWLVHNKPSTHQILLLILMSLNFLICKILI